LTPTPDDALTAGKVAQLAALIKNNQITSAVLVVLAWQLGIFGDALSYAGGLC